MRILDIIKRRMILQRNKKTGISPYVRGKTKINNVLNLKISKFSHSGKVHNVVTRRDVNSLIKISKGRSQIAKKAEGVLFNLQRRKVLVKEKRFGKFRENSQLGLVWFDKLTGPNENIGAVKRAAKTKLK
ncbi:MAG: hypothetical protein PHX27_01575 [Candidatus ainarchaeum sp.]|nr:hypothetical protein [Candidatus ainarchaeum sp.]